MIDEGPSPEDMRRFSRETAYCPECGAEIWDQAEACPKCHAYLGGNTSHRPLMEAWFRRKWIILVAILAVIALVLYLI